MKQNHPDIECILFVYRAAKEYSKAYPALVVSPIVFSVLSDIPPLFISSLAVKYLSETQDYPHFALYAGILLGACFLLKAFTVYLNDKVTVMNNYIRIRTLFKMSNEKSMTCDYSFFESSRQKELKENAEHALSSNWNGAELILKSFPSFFSEAGFNFLAQFLNNRQFQKLEDKKEKERQGQDYLLLKSREEQSKKDIPNYSLSNMFLAFLTKKFDFFSEYTKL